jgi:hypothetical protein
MIRLGAALPEQAAYPKPYLLIQVASSAIIAWMKLYRDYLLLSFTLLPLLGAGLEPVAAEPDTTFLHGSSGVVIRFGKGEAGWSWTTYEDEISGRRWDITGPRFSVQTPDGVRTSIGEEGFKSLKTEVEGSPAIVLDTELAVPAIAVRQRYSFAGDGRTVRISTSLRSLQDPVVIQRVGLLEVGLAGENLRLNGPELVSCPIFGDRIFAGVEHPSAWRQVDGDSFYLAQHSYTRIETGWVDLPPAVFGSASERDVSFAGKEAVRRAFLRYLDTVRVKPSDLHVHYNDWWTAPVPSSETDVLKILSELKRGLFDPTGFFFDSYAMDMGWSDPHTVWGINKGKFPAGFSRIGRALQEVGAHPGLWISPSSLYPPALDNEWLADMGYETSPLRGIGASACLAKGGKYQIALKEAALRHARENHLAHMKFDGYIPSCDVAEHHHPVGSESYLPIAEGLMEVFDALRGLNPDIAMEPTCFGYYPSPWWLMHVPFIIGPFGDDSPHGRCPCPEWLESMITGRDIANLTGRDAFLLPSSALQCFDIVYQWPGDFQNMAAMAVGRGRWFISCYINPGLMNPDRWKFFAELIRWARHNKEFLQEPDPVGGDPAKREAYGYRFAAEERQLFCFRNPWIEEASAELVCAPMRRSAREVRMIYPRREVLAQVAEDEELPTVRIAPYETQFVEVAAIPSVDQEQAKAAGSQVTLNWEPQEGTSDHIGGKLSVQGALSGELCVLCEGAPEVKDAHCTIRIDGEETPVGVSRSAGSFAASGQPIPEHWIWFLSPVGGGEHSVSIDLKSLPNGSSISAFVRGFESCGESPPGFGPGPAFPLFRERQKGWSRALAPRESQ